MTIYFWQGSSKVVPQRDPLSSWCIVKLVSIFMTITMTTTGEYYKQEDFPVNFQAKLVSIFIESVTIWPLRLQHAEEQYCIIQHDFKHKLYFMNTAVKVTNLISYI